MGDDEGEKRGIARSSHFRAYVGEQAEKLMRAILQTYQCMAVEQQQLLLELGYSFTERFALSIQLAENLYHIGLPGYPPERLQDLLREGMLQAILYQFLCQGEGYSWAVAYLSGDPAFRKQCRITYEETYGRLPDYSYDLSRNMEEEHGGVSPVSPANRRTRSRTLVPRTRRPGGRVGWGDLGTVSEP